MFETFHFLRPWWLLAILPAAFLAVCIWRRQDSTRSWRRLIAPHLLAHLRVGTAHQSRVRPVTLLLLAWVLGTLALAGPTWRREPAPFADDTAALVIALEVTPSMEARDVQPSRLERAVHKIKDLLALRGGAKTALVAYAGSAHLVMPLTRDARIVEVFAAEVAPDIMPVKGDATQRALELADEQLAAAGVAGSVLLVTDGVPADQVRELTARFPVHVLAVGTEDGSGGSGAPAGSPAPALNRASLEAVAEKLGGSLTIVTADDLDVRRVAARVERSLVTAAKPDGGERWRDAGYWFVPWIALLCLIWFRPGWTVAYA